MTSPSPYRPPRGSITPAPPARYGEIRPFSHRGRLGRVRYIGYSVGLGLLINLVAVALGGMVTISAGGGGGGVTEVLMTGGFIILVILTVTLSTLLTIQRLHDFDASGWWAVLLLAPLANLVLYLVLLIMPGTQGANRFGDPTPPNTTGVIFLALVLPAVFIVGLIAAIAIPAYQDYVERTQAAGQNAPPQTQ